MTAQVLQQQPPPPQQQQRTMRKSSSRQPVERTSSSKSQLSLGSSDSNNNPQHQPPHRQQQQQHPQRRPAPATFVPPTTGVPKQRMSRMLSGRLNNGTSKLVVKREEEEETVPTTTTTDEDEEEEDEEQCEHHDDDDNDEDQPLLLSAPKLDYDPFAPMELLPESEQEQPTPKISSGKSHRNQPPPRHSSLQSSQQQQQQPKPEFKKTDSFKKRKQRAQKTQALATQLQRPSTTQPTAPLHYWNIANNSGTPGTTSASDSSFLADLSNHRKSHVDLLLNDDDEDDEDDTNSVEDDEPVFLQKIPEKQHSPAPKMFPLSPTRRTNPKLGVIGGSEFQKLPPLPGAGGRNSKSKASFRTDESTSSHSTAPSTVRSVTSSSVLSTPSASPVGRATATAGSIVMTPIARLSSPRSPMKTKIVLNNHMNAPKVHSLEQDSPSTHKSTPSTKVHKKKKKPAAPAAASRKVHFAPDGILSPQKKEDLPFLAQGPKLITLYWFEKQDEEEQQPKPTLLDATLEQGRRGSHPPKSPEATRKSLRLDEYSIGKDHESSCNDADSVGSDSSTDSTIRFLESHLDETTWANCRLALTKLYFAHDKSPEERDSICEKTTAQLYDLYDFTGSLKNQHPDDHSRRRRGTIVNDETEEHTLRGLESSLCPQVIETLRIRHMEQVLQAAKKGSPKQVRAASLQTSRPFRFVGWQMAKYDTHIALVSVLQSWTTTTVSRMGPTK